MALTGRTSLQRQAPKEPRRKTTRPARHDPRIDIGFVPA